MEPCWSWRAGKCLVCHWGDLLCVSQESLEENGYFPCRENIILIQHWGGGRSKETGHEAENNAKKKVSNSTESWPEYSWSNSENYTAASCSGVGLRNLIAYCLTKKSVSRTSFHHLGMQFSQVRWRNVIQFYLTSPNKQLKFCIDNLLYTWMWKERIIGYGSSVPKEELPWHEIQDQDSVSYQLNFLL